MDRRCIDISNNQESTFYNGFVVVVIVS